MEGGEGLVSAQYAYAHRSLGREDLEAGKAKAALKHFEAARHYPENLGEGKHLLTSSGIWIIFPEWLPSNLEM